MFKIEVRVAFCLSILWRPSIVKNPSNNTHLLAEIAGYLYQFVNLVSRGVIGDLKQFFLAKNL